MGLGEYLNELKKAEEKYAYKVFEKHAKSIGMDIENQQSDAYFQIVGEAVSFQYIASVWETKETLLKKVKPKRDDVANNLIHPNYISNLVAIMPQKCTECDFHRFFQINIISSSIGQNFTISCPNCQKVLAEVVDDNP